MGNPPAHRAKKIFGQNFLHDQGVIRRIITSISPKPGDHLVEIGPGQGAITRELLKATGRLQAVELDRDLLEPLAQACGDLGELHIFNADAMKFDFCQLAEDGNLLRLVGNLPYNISTPILFHLLEQAHCIEDMHFMLQKEVVDRIAAGPGSKTYGRLSVMIQSRCKVSNLFDIGPGAFKPAPKVDSGFLRLTPYKDSPYDITDQARFSGLVTQAFSQRRKTLRNCLKKMIDAEIFEAAGIDPTLRAEQLAVEDFVRLANMACKTA
ncbi:16S rRNA (adenine(1518)-N(6)/adenine(1519)-N(6))-dimethyltransferase RsmA [Solemya velesiana gill symbiont]|uniref:Ribosomal RNA small subunit methyltransferase A n=1 Tax=Solemya velesiana gill symbiont TaxID=1918948 RepID=A0A1T2KR97_9GAMM|nr:16S rRNA (adenine(1518)-N(6)/adenine(1519)-N(6))-dimethyltransferase RsmA [Solemya velesiana gill symbiont]OOZ35385.1 16S rRNA (adenine(1518)-N(6)/adenine(1519)-N(6))-dimethyltransferase [Solemya velesiana gill symbiont]